MTSERYAIGLARAFGGAIIFGLPLLMTMEMWSLGFAMGRGRLLLLVAFTLVLLVGLSYFSGFEKTWAMFIPLRIAPQLTLPVASAPAICR